MFPQARSLALGHGAFFLVSGLWPLVSIRTFEKVTGPKTDDWLVKTVGLLIATTGSMLLFSAARSRKPPVETAALAASQSAVLGGISFYYAWRGRISKIYLADSLVESLLATAWTIIFRDRLSAGGSSDR